MKIKNILAIATIFITMSAANTSSAANYTFTELSPIAGGGLSMAYGINNAGQVVGTTDFPASCMNCGGYTRATFWNNNSPTQLNSLGNDGYALDINDAGTVVGYTSPKYTTHYQAAVWQSGTIGYLTSLDYNTVAYGINNNGHIAGNTWQSTSSAMVWDGPSGSYLDGKGGSGYDINDLGQVAGNIGANAVVWNGISPTFLNSLTKDGSSKAEAINNSGQVVGSSLAASGFNHATLWDGVTALDLGTLGDASYAFGVNNSGMVVGTSNTSLGGHAFLWDGSRMLDLNSLLDQTVMNAGWILNGAMDINDHGQIVGGAHNSITGKSVAFLLTPVPEPETYGMLIAGLGIMGVVVRRRKLQSFGHNL